MHIAYVYLDYLKKKCQKFLKLNHMNVLGFVLQFIHNKKFYVVTEYAEGGSLKLLADKKGKMQEDEAKEYIKQIYNAIKYCHDKNLAHGNLKLKNIYFKIPEDDKICVF